jgi:hypothetical protein
VFVGFFFVKFSVFVPGRARQFKDILSGPIGFNESISGRIWVRVWGRWDVYFRVRWVKGRVNIWICHSERLFLFFSFFWLFVAICSSSCLLFIILVFTNFAWLFAFLCLLFGFSEPASQCIFAVGSWPGICPDPISPKGCHRSLNYCSYFIFVFPISMYSCFSFCVIVSLELISTKKGLEMKKGSHKYD